MSNNIDLKQGLNIPISGTAAQKTRKTIVPDVIAIKPTDSDESRTYWRKEGSRTASWH